MKKLFIFLSLIVLFLSCSKEEMITEQNDRLQFANIDELNSTFLNLTNLVYKDEMLNWAKSKNHSTLFDNPSISSENYSDVIKIIFNKNAECEIGENIIWLNNNILYSFSKKEELYLEELKQKPENCKIYFNLGDQLNLKTTQMRDNTLLNHQKEFNQQYYQKCGGTRSNVAGARKFVHELDVVMVQLLPTKWQTRLFLKFEYKDSKGNWNNAGEQRKIVINVHFTSSMGADVTINETVDCLSSTRYYTLDYQNPNGIYYAVTVTGTIKEIVKGDVTANEWLDYFNW